MSTTEQQQAWSSGRPVFDRLPEKNYKDNWVSDSLTRWVDQDLSEKAIQLSLWYTFLDTDACPDELLDYLGALVGFSDSYWDTEWSLSIKRNFIRYSHTYLWPNKGTLECLKKVMEILEIDADIWQEGNLRLSFPLGSKFAAADFRFYVRVNLAYLRGQKQWKEVERAIRNYAPAICESKVSYKQFYLSISRLGEPLWR